MEKTREHLNKASLLCSHGRIVTLAAAPAHRSAWARSHKIMELRPRFALEVLGRCAPGTYCLVWVLHYDILSSLGV